jgi:hypothetical protein
MRINDMEEEKWDLICGSWKQKFFWKGGCHDDFFSFDFWINLCGLIPHRPWLCPRQSVRLRNLECLQFDPLPPSAILLVHLSCL